MVRALPDPFAPERSGVLPVLMWLLAGAMVLAIIGGLAYSVVTADTDIDPETLCRKSGPTAIVSVLIDRTDTLSRTQIVSLRGKLLEWAEDVPVNGLFQIYEVAGAHAEMKPLLTVCNPGTGEDKSELNSSPRQYKKAYREKYRAPVEDLVASIVATKEADASPILEALQAVSLHDRGQTIADQDRIDYRKIILVSDLLQFGPEVNAYKNDLVLEDLVNSPYGRTVVPVLDGVEMEIWLLNRPKVAKRQTDGLLNFWVGWVMNGGAYSPFVGKISG